MYNNKKTTLREIKLPVNSQNIRAILGYINNKDKKVMYIKLNSWCRHNKSIDKYDQNVTEFVRNFKFNFKKKLRETNMFIDDIIFNIHFKKIIIKPDDIFFTTFESTIKQKNETPKPIEQITPIILEICNDVINDMVKGDSFNFYNTKKAI